MLSAVAFVLGFFLLAALPVAIATVSGSPQAVQTCGK